TRRALDVPSRGVGLKTVEHLSEFARARKLSLAEAIHRSDELAELPSRAAAGLRHFSTAVKRAQAHFYACGSAVAPLQGLLEGVGLREYVVKEAGSEAAATARWGGVVWLLE